MNFFKRANSLNISIRKPLIVCPSLSVAGVADVVGVEVGTGGGAISEVVEVLVVKVVLRLLEVQH